MQVATAHLRRLNPADDPLKTEIGDKFDQLHALGGSPSGRTATTDKLGQLFSQYGVREFHKPRGEAAALPWCHA